MTGWIGPALVAAVIAALVSVVGWFVTAGLTFRAEQRRRDEKTRDFMIALRAEIRSEMEELERFDLNADLARVHLLYGESSSYHVFVSKLVDHVVVNTITPEIFILPEGIIDPVVVYLRQRNNVRMLIAEVRELDLERYDRNQEILLYDDLNDKRSRLLQAARSALSALENAS